MTNKEIVLEKLKRLLEEIERMTPEELAVELEKYSRTSNE